MFELTDASGVLNRCMSALWDLLNDWEESVHSAFLPFLAWFLTDLNKEYDEIMDNFFAVCVGLSAAIWARMVVVYLSYPFRQIPPS